MATVRPVNLPVGVIEINNRKMVIPPELLNLLSLTERQDGTRLLENNTRKVRLTELFDWHTQRFSKQAETYVNAYGRLFELRFRTKNEEEYTWYIRCEYLYNFEGTAVMTVLQLFRQPPEIMM